MRLLQEDTLSSGPTGTLEEREGEMLSVPLSLDESGLELAWMAKALSSGPFWLLGLFLGPRVSAQKGELRFV